jgi:hypothetical protein
MTLPNFHGCLLGILPGISVQSLWLKEGFDVHFNVLNVCYVLHGFEFSSKHSPHIVMDLRGEKDYSFFYADSIQRGANVAGGLYVLVAYVKKHEMKI